jgi:hypothetical protein
MRPGKVTITSTVSLVTVLLLLWGCSSSANEVTRLPVVPTSTPVDLDSTGVTTLSPQPRLAEPECILTSTACSLPCWEGIRPGETGLEDAWNLLSSSTLVDPDSIRLSSVSPTVGGIENKIYWLTPNSENSRENPPEGWWNVILVRAGVVDSIELQIDVYACSLTLGTLIARYGSPVKVVYDPHAHFGDVHWYELDLLYPAHGLAFAAYAQNPPVKKASVGKVYCFQSMSIEQLISEPTRYGFQRPLWNEKGNSLESWEKHLEDWKGFADGDLAP